MSRPLIAVTGAGGFLGRGMCGSLSKYFDLREADIAEFKPHGEKYIGDVSKPEFCDKLLDGADHLVIAHMASYKGPDPYPVFNSNVTGTANLFYAAVQHRIKRVCLISSIGAIQQYFDAGLPLSTDLPFAPVGNYTASKACQEIIAKMFHFQYHIPVTVFRINYVVDLEKMVNKIGEKIEKPEPGMLDPHDCGEAVANALRLQNSDYKLYHLYGIMSEHERDGLAARRELAWRPFWNSEALMA